ncbi:S8 family peptidase [Parachitinimonas caeni]|uniref:S8 family serine peptidase n=1 Tax=Parachitinimonas caeni TaxID=3031301 RepID=A0ABT7DQS1_9NEIS|nr:S8 family serine peptidase [Parachitinimonas caeni]MDK2122436.1 S8 family serine peptidase [Parachitinimonas caeni]
MTFRPTRIALILSLLSVSISGAHAADQIQLTPQSASLANIRRSEVMDTHLQLLSKQANPVRTRAAAQIASDAPPAPGVVLNLPPLENGWVRIEAMAKDRDEALLRELTAAGVIQLRQSGNLLTGLIPPAALGNLEKLTQARFVRQALGGKTNKSVVSQGDAGQASDRARARFKVDGKGANVGVISDSYDRHQGASKGIAAGELPGPGNPNGYLTAVKVVKESTRTINSDEGRAMLEIVHDIAPGASLSFYGAENHFDHAEGIRQLAKAGATVIVDDLTWFGEPWFQEGPIARAASDVMRQNNAVTLTSAGNEANNSAEGVFNPLPESEIHGPLRDGGFGLWDSWRLHDWGNGAKTIPITLHPGSAIAIILQWDEPFASVSQNRQGAGSDLDMFWFSDPQGRNVVFSSTTGNLNGDAIETLFPSLPGNAQKSETFYLGLGRWSGSKGNNPGKFKVLVYEQDGPSATLSRPHFNSATILGHANAPQILSVGAVNYDQINLPTGPRPWEKSAVGGFAPTRDANGNPVRAIPTSKPDFSSPHRANTSFFGIDRDGDGLPNFQGTSAAAPHAAGVVALMQSAAGMNLPAYMVKTMLTVGSTIDMDDPYATPWMFDYSFDNKSGWGFLNAEAAVRQAMRYRR